ncbi:MAG: 50S ribosomal protein L11 methyltransferase [Alphaproteobacteria bacterium]|nr:50S ribosomal protein L11 methyltransferase [Alphaproteobacteria bacterium]
MAQTEPDSSGEFFWIDIMLPARVDDSVAGSLLEALNDWALSATAIRADNKHTHDWHLRWMVEGYPDRDEVLLRVTLALQLAALDLAITPEQIIIEPVPQIDWLAHSYQQFAPFTVGEFFIFGSHYAGDKPADKRPLQIDAATAFGSGEHGTTAGCLEALQDLKNQGFAPAHTLDLGTGSGILAIAAWKLWGTPVLATDIDPECVRVTNLHAHMNDTPLDSIALTTEVADGFQSPRLNGETQFNLVIANILAGPLITMSADLIKTVAPGGYVLLSGMLGEQAPDVAAAYTGKGLSLVKRYDREDWTSLLLQR